MCMNVLSLPMRVSDRLQPSRGPSRVSAFNGLVPLRSLQDRRFFNEVAPPHIVWRCSTSMGRAVVVHPSTANKPLVYSSTALLP